MFDLPTSLPKLPRAIVSIRGDAPPLLTDAGLRDLAAGLAKQNPALFLDFNGTAPVSAARATRVCVDAAMRKRLHRLSRLCPIAILGSHDLSALRAVIGMQEAFGADRSAPAIGPQAREFGGA